MRLTKTKGVLVLAVSKRRKRSAKPFGKYISASHSSGATTLGVRVLAARVDLSLRNVNTNCGAANVKTQVPRNKTVASYWVAKSELYKEFSKSEVTNLKNDTQTTEFLKFIRKLMWEPAHGKPSKPNPRTWLWSITAIVFAHPKVVCYWLETWSRPFSKQYFRETDPLEVFPITRSKPHNCTHTTKEITSGLTGQCLSTAKKSMHQMTFINDVNAIVERHQAPMNISLGVKAGRQEVSDISKTSAKIRTWYVAYN